MLLPNQARTPLELKDHCLPSLLNDHDSIHPLDLRGMPRENKL
jgi:hypothetical protein